jgi:hypothetical protein
MEFDKNLIKYIKPSVKLYIFTLISFVMLIALLCGYLYFNKLYDDKEPEKFTRESKNNAYAYIDIQYLLDWPYENRGNKHYFAFDKEENIYIVIIDDEEMYKYLDIINYTYNNDDDENAIAPPPVRAIGTVQKATRTTAKGICNMVSYDSVEEYYNILGKTVLNTKTTPATKYAGKCIFFSIFVMPIFIVCFINIIKNLIYYSKSIKKLNDTYEYDRAYDELNQENRHLLNENGIILTENYMFVKNKGIAINYKNLYWCYMRKQSYNGFVIERSLIIYTISQGKYILSFFRKKYEFLFDKILDIISNRNNEVLCGYEKVYIDKYKLKMKEIRNNKTKKSDFI